VHHAYIDKYAHLDSPVHRLDSRVKTIVVLIFSVVVVSAGKYKVVELVPFAILPFSMILVGGIPVRFVLRQTLWVSPFVVFVALLNPVFDAEKVRVTLGGGEFLVRRGWLSCGSIVVKFTLTVSALMALMSTSKFSDLLRGLESLRVPKVFIMQLSLVYRYLFVLVDEVMRMTRAAEGRALSLRGRLGVARAYVSIIGTLLVRTLDRAERVHKAMVGRGFDGTVRTLTAPRLAVADFVFLGGAVAFVLVVRLAFV